MSEEDFVRNVYRNEVVTPEQMNTRMLVEIAAQLGRLNDLLQRLVDERSGGSQEF